MAQAITIQSSFASARGEGLLAGLAARLAAHRRYRATRRELAALSDRDLADLGIYRSAIEEIATRAAYKA